MRVLSESTGLGVAVQGLTHAYGDDGNRLVVLDHLDLMLQPGDHLAVTGRSGAGKSTLLAVLGGLELGEAGFDDGHRGAVVVRRQRELDVRAARVTVGQAVDAPRIPEDRLRLDPLDAQLGSVTTVPGQLRGAADPEVDLRAVAEPGTEPFGRRDGRPHAVQRPIDAHRALNPIRESHRGTSSSSNHSVAMTIWQPSGCVNPARRPQLSQY